MQESKQSERKSGSFKMQASGTRNASFVYVQQGHEPMLLKLFGLYLYKKQNLSVINTVVQKNAKRRKGLKVEFVYRKQFYYPSTNLSVINAVHTLFFD